MIIKIVLNVVFMLTLEYNFLIAGWSVSPL